MGDETQLPVIGVIPLSQLNDGWRRQIIALCESVFSEDFSTFFESLGDSTHVLVWSERGMIAHACWVDRWLQPEGLPLMRTAYVKAVAVMPECQRQGWGTRLMWQIGWRILDAEYDLGALTTVIPEYYARLGWERWRGPTAIRTANGLLPTPGKWPMFLRSPKIPPLDLGALLTAEWRADALW